MRDSIIYTITLKYFPVKGGLLPGTRILSIVEYIHDLVASVLGAKDFDAVYSLRLTVACTQQSHLCPLHGPTHAFNFFLMGDEALASSCLASSRYCR